LPLADDSLPAADQSFAQVDQWIAEGQYLKAHRDLSQRYWKEQAPLEPLLQRLNKTAGMIYFAPNAHFMKAYEVQPGDLLQSIAPRYKLSWEYLARLNRVRPQRIRPGQELKVIKGPFSAFVDLSDFSLTIHAHGYFVKRYAIGIGKDNTTPIGTFSVKEKLKNPKYYGSDQVIEADDPNNPLGERWISIGDSYGIHGTIDPTSIGKAASRGCLRLTNDDVVEVYDFLVPGSEVVIRP
jgi:LysM repeat protein